MRVRLKPTDRKSPSRANGGASIEPFDARDIDGGMRLKRSAGWNQTEEDWRALLDLSGDGSVGAKIDDYLVGSALVLEYDVNDGGRIGWVSMVLVDPSFRRRGIGTQLLDAAITRSSDLRAHMLDATSAGMPVYERIGFTPVDAITRWRLKESDRRDSLELGRSVDESLRLGGSSTEMLFSADRSATGFSRTRLVGELVRRWNPITSDLGGIVFGRDGSGAHQIGPIISSTADDAKELIDRAVRTTRGELIIDIRDRHVEVAEFAEGLGFRRERSFSRMVKSDAASLPEPDESLIAIAGPEFG